jgi:hypothetical protein
MKVLEDETDRYGRSMFVFSGVKNIDEVYTWLQQHYSGYKFGMVFDCTRDELQEPDRKFYVYFLDELTEEVMAYSDFIRVDKKTWKSKY